MGREPYRSEWRRSREIDRLLGPPLVPGNRVGTPNREMDPPVSNAVDSGLSLRDRGNGAREGGGRLEEERRRVALARARRRVPIPKDLGELHELYGRLIRRWLRQAGARERDVEDMYNAILLRMTEVGFVSNYRPELGLFTTSLEAFVGPQILGRLKDQRRLEEREILRDSFEGIVDDRGTDGGIAGVEHWLLLSQITDRSTSRGRLLLACALAVAETGKVTGANLGAHLGVSSQLANRLLKELDHARVARLLNDGWSLDADYVDGP